MGWRQGLLIFGAAALAACLGLVASVALYGPGPLMRSQLGQQLLQPLLGAGDPPGLRVVELGEAVPRIRLFDLQGQLHVLPRPGRRVVLNYWAGWCGPCREEMPLLADYSRRKAGSGVEVVGIALDTTEGAQAFLSEFPVPFATPVEAPGERDSSVQLGNRRSILPFTVLISADGKLVKRQFGAFASRGELEAWAEQDD